MNSKRFLRPVITTVAVLVAFSILFTILNTAAYMLPVNKEKYDYSFDILDREGWYPEYPVINKLDNTFFTTYLPGVLDNNTMKTVFRIAFDTSERASFSEALKKAVVPTYSRYWHGYIAVLRPLMNLLDYEQMQILNSFLLITLVAFVAIGFYKRGGIKKALMYLSSVMLIMPMAIGICFQYTWVFHIANIAILIYFRKQDWFEQGNRYFFYFLVIGIFTVYLDLLTYPLYAWALPAFTWILFDKKDRFEGRKGFINVFKLVIPFTIGYAGVWFLKWIIASLVLRRNELSEAVREVLARSGSGFTLRDRIFTYYRNWKHYSYIIYLLILIAWLLWWLILGVIRGYKKNNRAIAIGLIALSPVAWYTLASNHCYVHHAFTYRNLSIMFAAGIALMVDSIPEKRIEEQSLKRRLATSFITCCIAGFISIGLMMVSREDTETSNKESIAGFDEYTLQNGLHLDFDLTPRIKDIVRVCIGLQSDSTEGNYVYTVSDESGEVYRIVVPITGNQGYNYYLQDVNWRLIPGKTYRFSAWAEGNNSDVKFYLSKDGTRYLEELTGTVNVGGIPYSGEPLVGYSYWFRSPSRYVKLSLVLFWFGVLTVSSYTLWCVYHIIKADDAKKNE